MTTGKVSGSLLSSSARSGIALVGRASDSKQNDSRRPSPSPACRRLIELIDDDGFHVCWLDESAAHEMLAQKRAESLVTKRGRLKALRATPETKLTASGSGPRPARYSHDRETRDNPRGCWTLIRLPRSTRPVYTAVLDQVAA